jgi:transcriptional regulator with GAF, ATPase, and Fis domain
LETRRIRRVGGEAEIAVDIRVIAATNRNLAMEVEREKFRSDLYFRLAVVPIHLPALRERRGDIPAIARALLAHMAQHLGRTGSAANPGALPEDFLGAEFLAALAGHDWPGNVRELRNVLERAWMLATAQGHASLSPSLLPFSAPEPTLSPVAVGAMPSLTFDPTRSYGDQRAEFETELERQYVTWLLERHAGNISAAAREADMDRKHLHKLARKHGVKTP